MSVRRPYGVRRFNPPQYLRIIDGGSADIAADFPVFTFVGAVTSDSIVAPFPAFELSGFVMSRDEMAAAFPAFEVSFGALAGGISSFNAEFPLFDASFTAQRATTLQAVFPAFAPEFTTELYAEATLFAQWPIFTAALTAELVELGVATSSDYVVWLVNQDTKAHSTYTNWQVNSWGVFGDAEFVATPDGIFELTGDADTATPIEAKIYWVPSNLGTSKQKRIDAAYAKVRGDQSPVRIVAWCDETQKRIYTKDMSLFPRHLHPARILFTRNLNGQIWQIGFENVDGGDFDLAEIELVPIALSRRLK